jgi:hypothetical protein
VCHAVQHKKIIELDTELRTSRQYIKKTNFQGSDAGATPGDAYDAGGGLESFSGMGGGFGGMALDRV